MLLLRTLALTLVLLASAAFAENPTPELITWQQFQYLNPVKKALYLKLIESAISDFERDTTGAYTYTTAGRFAEIRDLFALNLSPLPQAVADSECDRTQFVNSGASVCVKITNPGRGFSLDCRESEVATHAASCTPAALKYASDPANNGKQPKNKQALLDGFEAGKAAARNDKIAADQAAYDKRMADMKASVEQARAEDRTNRQNILKEASNNPNLGVQSSGNSGAQCPNLGLKESRKLRQAYRKKGNACLIGGVISGYSTPGKPCDVVQSTPPDEEDGDTTARRPAAGPSACTDDNMFTTGDASKIKSERRTVCQPLLYCRKDKKPFCVEASADTLGNCAQAVKTNKDKFAFGMDCMPGNIDKAREAWKGLSGSLGDVCNPRNSDTKQTTILCSDCKKLAQALHEAESQAGPPPAGPNGTSTPSGSSTTR